MRIYLHVTALLLVVVLAQLFTVPSAQAAPGAFLSKWSAQQIDGEAAGVAVDKDDNYYLTKTDCVEVYNSSGALIKKFGSFGSGDGQFIYPSGIAVDRNGMVYVADGGNSRVQVFNTSGAFLYKWTDRAPSSIATDGESVYVLGGGAIRLYDNDGTFLEEFGGYDACCNAVDDLTLTNEGLLYVLYYGEGLVIRVYAGTELLDTYRMSGYWGAIGSDSQGNIYISGHTPPGDFLRVYDRDLQPIRSLIEGRDLQADYIAVDSKGNIFVRAGGLHVMDSAGNPRLGFLNVPQSLGTDKSGNVYVVDSHDLGNYRLDNRVQVFSSTGQPLRQWTGSFCKTRGVAVDGSGNVHVLHQAETYSNCTPDTSLGQVFDSAGNFLRSWGKQTGSVFGLAIDKNGRFLVTDDTNHLIQVYGSDGAFITSFGSPGTGDGQFSTPGGIAVDANGNIFVVDSGNSRIEVFDNAYGFIRTWGSKGSGSGQLINPAGIALDGKGHVFVVDSGNNRIQVFDPSGNFLLAWGRFGEADGLFKHPQGILVDNSGEKVYVADLDNSRIQVFEGYPALFSVSGTVRQGSATGPVLAGATVVMAGKTATTSSAGTFSFTGIAPGTYTLTISKAGYVTKAVTGLVVNADVVGAWYYLFPAYTVSGTVRQGSATGPVLPGATVSIAGKSATTTSTGTFSITGIPAGTYTLTISKTGYATKTVTGFVVNADVIGAWYYLFPAYTLSGTVRQGSATGPVLPGARVAIAGKSATTTSTGAFSITGIPTGTYTLTISRTGYATKSVSGYVVNSDKSGVVYYLTPATYGISGTVRQGSSSGAVLAGATVSLAGKSAITGSTGTFGLTGIPAGTYTLTISKTGYATKTVTGYVVNSNKSGVVFYLTPATYSISGTVRQGSTSGPVLAGATVSLAGKSAVTSSTGAFALTGIPAGSYTLTISRTGYVTKTVTGYVVNSNKSGVVYYLNVAAVP